MGTPAEDIAAHIEKHIDSEIQKDLEAELDKRLVRDVRRLQKTALGQATRSPAIDIRTSWTAPMWLAFYMLAPALTNCLATHPDVYKLGLCCTAIATVEYRPRLLRSIFLGLGAGIAVVLILAYGKDF